MKYESISNVDPLKDCSGPLNDCLEATRARRQHPAARAPARMVRCFAPALVAVVVLMNAGCSGFSARKADQQALLQRVPELNTQLFGTPRPVPQFDELTALSPEQKADFDRYFYSGVESRFEAHRRLMAYLERNLADTAFENRTLSASETIEAAAGNCMSLALVTTAYARLADIKIGWQISDTRPVYSSDGSVIYSANHIQTRLYHRDYDQSTARFNLNRPYLLVDYYSDNPPRTGTELSEDEVIALVYQNLGVEALSAGRMDDAFWLLRAGLDYDPANANVYNALAVLHRRAGDAQTAEQLYRFALDEFGDRLIVLRNYRRLLLTQNRTKEAERIVDRIMVLPDPDPYPLLRLGDEAANDGQMNLALAHYRKASDLAPYLHEIYMKIAEVHVRNNDLDRAESALRQARDLARAQSDQHRYDAKLAALEKN